MAVLGSTVDPRLGAVSPAAIQALSQAGAATGQMYANLGRSIAGVIQDAKSRRDDSSLQQAYLESLQIDDDGNQKVDRKAFLQKAKDNKVSSRLANAYLKNELEISSIQNQMDIRNKMANLEGRKVGVAEDQQKLAGEMFDFEKEFKTADQKLKISQWASDNLLELQKLNAMREANEITQKQYDKDYKLAKKKYRSELRKLDQSEDLTRAQKRALKAETLLKSKEAALTQAEIDAYENPEGLMTNEAALINGVVDILRMEKSDFESLSPMDRKALLDSRLRRIGEEGNPNAEDIQPLKKLSDFYLNRGLASMTDEEYAAYKQQQQQAPENLSYLAQADRFFANRASARQN